MVVPGCVPAPPSSSFSAASTASAVRRPTPGTSVMASTVAARSFLTDPKCFSSAVRRVSPSPGTPSRAELVIRVERFWRW